MQKILLFTLALLTFPAFALTGDMAANAVGWDTALVMLFGESGALVVAWVGIALAFWSQVRQIIPAHWLARLPTWLIWLLEFLAANKGNAANDLSSDPAWQRKQKKLGID